MPAPVEEARADGVAVSTRAGVVVQILRERASRPREHRHNEGEGGGAVPEAERGARGGWATHAASSGPYPVRGGRKRSARVLQGFGGAGSRRGRLSTGAPGTVLHRTPGSGY